MSIKVLRKYIQLCEALDVKPTLENFLKASVILKRIT